MAHFAKLGIDNIVLAVLAMDTVDTMTRGGIEKEEIGVEHLVKHHGHENWKQCSYNSRAGVHYDAETNEPSGKPAFRANYPGIGWYYNSEHDIFHPAKPEDCDSWTLNTTTGLWDAPIPQPELTQEQKEAHSYYIWDESAYQADNTTGWVLETQINN
jgi:hypothetical protein